MRQTLAWPTVEGSSRAGFGLEWAGDLPDRSHETCFRSHAADKQLDLSRIYNDSEHCLCTACPLLVTTWQAVTTALRAGKVLGASLITVSSFA